MVTSTLPIPSEVYERDEWDLRNKVLGDIGQRIDRVREQCETLLWYLDREDELPLDNLLNLHDSVVALEAMSIIEQVVVDDTGKTVTFDDWDDLVTPAIGKDELVLNASEYRRELDDTYNNGVTDAWFDAEDAGIDIGIKVAARVLRVLGATVVDLPPRD